MENGKVIIPADAVVISRVDYEMLIRISERYAVAKYIFAQAKNQGDSYMDIKSLEPILGDRAYKTKKTEIKEDEKNA